MCVCVCVCVCERMYLHVYVSCSCVVSGYSVINAKSLLSVSIFNSLLNVIETCKRLGSLGTVGFIGYTYLHAQQFKELAVFH